jgi:23S rRNA pseudouridine1911/1915/1917 synthase
MCRKIELNIKENVPERLDTYIAARLGRYTRSFVKKLIDGGQVLVNDRVPRAGDRPRAGDVVVVTIPPQREASAKPQDIPLDILYEDGDVAVINKPQGMVTHPAAGNEDGTLVNAALFHIRDLSGIGGEIRPGIVHRLDKDTSGLIVLAKNDRAHAALAAQLSERMVKKRYVALCHGNVRDNEGTMVTNIDRHPRDRKRMAVTEAGREAVTHYKVMERFGKYTLVEFDIETGRTHQIRVHAKHMGHPVVGDPVYTRLKAPFALKGQMLHARELSFIHPVTGEQMDLSAPLPAYFQNILEKLRR